MAMHRSLLILFLVSISFVAPARLRAQVAAGAPADQVIELGTLHGKMKYDLELIQVKPGARVKLIFKNTDEMQHNVVICRPGSDVVEVSQKAWALGEEAMKKQFVPEDARVLFHTRVVDPAQADSITFQVPQEEGDYPYVCTLPGHAYLMNGTMRVGAALAGLRDLEFAYYEGNWAKLPDFKSLQPKTTGKLPKNTIDLSVAEREDQYAIVFTGVLHVAREGEYQFFLSSDDGSRILLNDQPVVAYDGIHPAAEERRGVVKLAKGAHALRVEFFEGNHGQQLDVGWQGPNLPRTALSLSSPKATVDHRHHLHVMDKPLVIRAFVDGGPARAISVGLPGGTNYLFDAEKSAVAFGWSGDFLDAGPDRGRDEGDRGGGWCKILGQKFTVGAADFPLRFGDATKVPQVKFSGYRRGALPQFFMTADGVAVKQTVRAAPQGVGLQYDFEIEQPPGDVFFVVEPENLQLASSTGTWSGGTLRVPASEARKFTVTISKR
jgi:azurin